VGWSLPAITTARNGAADLLADGAGWVIDAPDDAKGLMAALDGFVDPARRARAASACGDRAGDITIDRHVTQLEELYRDILAQRDKEPAS
jgi:glycosyltransferase involved in cell wall biosynthesis